VVRVAIQVLAGFVVSVAGAGGGVLLQLCRGVGGAGSSGRGARMRFCLPGRGQVGPVVAMAAFGPVEPAARHR
jgi:hypothetical protein